MSFSSAFFKLTFVLKYFLCRFINYGHRKASQNTAIFQSDMKFEFVKNGIKWYKMITKIANNGNTINHIDRFVTNRQLKIGTLIFAL